jgi:putative multicomponent Na+:H+ antiporter subunit B
MIETLMLIGLVVLALVALNTASLRRAVIYLAVFSLLASFTYVIYRAPDVAIAEAVIGCGLATVLYLVALKRQRLLTVYFAHHEHDEISDQTVSPSISRLLRGMESVFAEKDLEMQVVHTTKPYHDLLDERDFDLLVVHEKEVLCFYGRPEDYHVDTVEAYLADYQDQEIKTRVIRWEED